MIMDTQNRISEVSATEAMENTVKATRISRREMPAFFMTIHVFYYFGVYVLRFMLYAPHRLLPSIRIHIPVSYLTRALLSLRLVPY